MKNQPKNRNKNINYFGLVRFSIFTVSCSPLVLSLICRLCVVSGIYGSKEDAQSQVSVGVGINAGITVFSLTIQWGMVMIYGKIDLKKISDELNEAFDSITSPSKGRTWILKGLDSNQHSSLFLRTMLSFFVCLF